MRIKFRGIIHVSQGHRASKSGTQNSAQVNCLPLQMPLAGLVEGWRDPATPTPPTTNVPHPCSEAIASE